MPNDTYHFTSADWYINNQHMGTTSGNLVWNTWLSTGTNSTSITTDGVWTVWNSTPISTEYVYRSPVRTPEQQAAYEADQARQQEEYRLACEKRKAEEAEAKQKARVILEENLTPEQRKQFADNAWFEVVTPKGTYRIRTGWSGNVDRLGADGRPTDRYCIHPSESIPYEDNMLAQKLLLEADEEAFLRIANRSTPYA